METLITDAEAREAVDFLMNIMKDENQSLVHRRKAAAVILHMKTRVMQSDASRDIMKPLGDAAAALMKPAQAFMGVPEIDVELTSVEVGTDPPRRLGQADTVIPGIQTYDETLESGRAPPSKAQRDEESVTRARAMARGDIHRGYPAGTGKGHTPRA